MTYSNSDMDRLRVELDDAAHALAEAPDEEKNAASDRLEAAALRFSAGWLLCEATLVPLERQRREEEDDR